MSVEIGNVWTRAHQSIEDGDVAGLVRLLDSGVDPNETCCGMSLLYHAVDYEADSAIQSGGEMGVVLIAVLLAYGASVDLGSDSGESPIELANHYGHDRAQRLLERFVAANPCWRDGVS